MGRFAAEIMNGFDRGAFVDEAGAKDLGWSQWQCRDGNQSRHGILGTWPSGWWGEGRDLDDMLLGCR